MLGVETGLQEGLLWGYCSPTLVHSKHTFSTDWSFTEPTKFSVWWMNGKKTCLWPGWEEDLVGLLAGELAGRSRVDGWEASQQDSRSLQTRWNLSSNPVLCSTCWETSGRSLDLPCALINHTVSLLACWKPDAASGKCWFRQNSLTTIYKTCVYSEQCWPDYQSQQMKLKWSLEIDFSHISALLFPY